MNDEPKDIAIDKIFLGEPRFMVIMAVADMLALFPEEFYNFVDVSQGCYILKEPVRVVHRDGKLQLVAERPFYTR